MPTKLPTKPGEKFQSSNDDLRRRSRLDGELQVDPELAEGPASGGRIALFAIAIIAIIGVVFYGLNNPSITPQPESTAQTTTTPATPPSTTATAPTPPPSQTTGSAMTPAQPANPSSSPPAASGSSSSSDSNNNAPQMNPVPSPSNSGTTQSGPPANN